MRSRSSGPAGAALDPLGEPADSSLKRHKARLTQSQTGPDKAAAIINAPDIHSVDATDTSLMSHPAVMIVVWP